MANGLIRCGSDSRSSLSNRLSTSSIKRSNSS
nr:MAG TPA: hypothetical protein [Caudoviricetes sp.]DAS82087.1 MAG TPA: hypothetical protein [Caudoviricetes sp.]